MFVGASFIEDNERRPLKIVALNQLIIGATVFAYTVNSGFRLKRSKFKKHV